MQRCRHAAISTHSRMGLWWATNQPPANGEPLDVASPVLRCQGRAMRTLRLSTVGAVCALGTVICFVLGGVAMGSSGVGVLIPEAGPPGRELIASVAGAGWLF